ncbi:hypothetical protein C8R43DRAFT_1017061 [Mycena crocata]|nr:hypothetical protein C8R43DRAFT_1017061 [Mycena crocata]
MALCDAGCGQEAEMRCSGCKLVRYCGAECQKKDWKPHKLDCASLLATGKPRTTHCTGCKVAFGARIGPVDETCPDCGYTACNDCICHNRRGTCYCPNSNFGHKYCGRVPEWYHYSGRTGQLYRGDNHPDEYDAELHETPAGDWEKEPRECGNCGERKICLRPGYICQSPMCQ